MATESNTIAEYVCACVYLYITFVFINWEPIDGKKRL